MASDLNDLYPKIFYYILDSQNIWQNSRNFIVLKRTCAKFRAILVEMFNDVKIFTYLDITELGFCFIKESYSYMLKHNYSFYECENLSKLLFKNVKDENDRRILINNTIKHSNSYSFEYLYNYFGKSKDEPTIKDLVELFKNN